MIRKTEIALGLWLAACLAFVPTVNAQSQEEEGAGEVTATAEEAVPEDAEATEVAVPEPVPVEEPTPEPEPVPIEEPAPEPEPVAVATEAVPVAEAADEALEEIVITGTRIKRKSLATAAPVTVLSKDDLLASGMMSVGEILQRLPANANALNVQFNNGGNGTTNVNLRSLDEVRTLVLVNGRRHVTGGDGANAAVDLNAIPVSIIERVEVLKDGASAIYGSDAIAGVVNIITRKDFTGVEANAYSGLSQRNDGAVYQVDVTTGVTLDKGNIVFSAMFYDQQPVFAGEREFSEIVRNDFDWEAWDEAGRPAIDRDSEFITPGGSIGTPQGYIIDLTGAPGNAAWDATGCAGGECFNDPDVGWRPAEAADAYNYQPENYLATPSRRLNFFTQGNYELSEYVSTFFEGSYTQRRSQQLLAPEPLYPYYEDIVVSKDNIYNPFGRDFGFTGRRMLEAGNRIFSQNSATYRFVMGLQGAIPAIGILEDWSWDAYVNFGRTDTINIAQGNLNRQKIELALGPASGCDPDDGCVALNVFGGAGTITDDMLEYIQTTAIDRGYNDQRIATVNLGGPVYELVENNPIAISFGYQFRREAGGDIPNPLAVSGDITGNKRDAVKGRFHVNAGYLELSLPIVAGLPGVELLELNAAGRLVDYSTFGSNFSYKLGARWQVTDFMAARGTYSTAFRAPAIEELYRGVYDSFPNVSDPCSSVEDVGQLDNPIVAQNCAADGLADGIPDPQDQLRSQEGGNPNLDPETAKIVTAGLVLEDKLVPGLSAAVDFYNINIDNAIQSIGSGVILASCYESDPDERQFCELIERGDGGFITNIIDTQNNVGGFTAQGIDFDVRYSLPTPVGRFGASLEGTVLTKLIQEQASGYEQSYKGNYDQASGSDPGANPDYKLRWSLLWARDMLNAGVNFRFIPSFVECDNGACEAKRAEDSDPPLSRDIDANFTMDLFAGVNVETFLGQTGLTVGINNVTDQDPPYIINGFLAESDAATYDYLGRYFYMRLSQQF